MSNTQLAEAAKILGVSEDSISAMDDEIKNSMTAVFEQVAVKNNEDKKAVFEALIIIRNCPVVIVMWRL